MLAAIMASLAWSRGRAIALWILTIIAGCGIGIAGLTKFIQVQRWASLFSGWGYPGWVMPIVGVVEVAGALVLFVPRLAAYGAVLLGIVMLGAFVTLLTHPGGPLGWGATPLVYFVMLLVVAIGRWRRG